MLKFDLTIRDLSQQDTARIMNLLNGDQAGAPLPMGISKIQDDNKVNVPFTPPAGTQLPAAAGVAGTTPLPDHVLTPEVNEDDSGDATVVGDVTGQVDDRGLPWDARIHSGNKKLTDRGVWQKRRGVQQAEIDAVEAELRNTPISQAPAPVNVPPVPGNPAPVAPAPQAPAAPTPPAALVPPQQPAAAPVAPAPITRDFQGLMALISVLFKETKITPDYFQTLISRIGTPYNTTLTAITDIVAYPHMVEYAFQLLQADGKIQ